MRRSLSYVLVNNVKMQTQSVDFDNNHNITSKLTSTIFILTVVTAMSVQKPSVRYSVALKFFGVFPRSPPPPPPKKSVGISYIIKKAINKVCFDDMTFYYRF